MAKGARGKALTNFYKSTLNKRKTLKKVLVTIHLKDGSLFRNTTDNTWDKVLNRKGKIRSSAVMNNVAVTKGGKRNVKYNT